MNEIIKSLKKRKLVLIAMVTFWSVLLIILIVHFLTHTTSFEIEYSISKHVGMSVVSSVTFLITNIYVSFLIWNALKNKIKDKTARILFKTILITLITLSVFPVGCYDNIITGPILFNYAPISLLHVISSRTMFVAMAAFALYTFFSERKNAVNLKTKISICFVAYAALCILLCVFFPDIFWGLNFIIESLYIAFFFIFIAAY